MKQYAVTGIGIINGLGETLAENWTNLLAGQTAIKEISWPEDNPKKFPKTHKSLTVKIGAPAPIPIYEEMAYGGIAQHWDPCIKLGIRSVEDAVKDSGIESKNVSVVYSTTGGNTVSRGYLTRALEDGRERILPRQVIQSTLDYLSGTISRMFEFNGLSTGINAACSTGLLSIDYALRTLETEPDIDAVVVGGADMPIEAYQCYYFQNLGALSNEPATPFDQNRAGFNAGEGAGCLVIEPLEKAKARGAKIYGLIVGSGVASAGHHDTSPDKDGIAAKTSVARALKSAGITTSDIGYINAHATGTQAGDDIEFYAMRELFPEKTMVANKAQIGHTLAASGIIETIYTLMALKTQTTPPTINLKTPIDSGMSIPTEASAINAKYAIKNNFAFSGRSACIVLKRYEE
jgi:3-oxoacyl-[acyl-carrier-protein] synthase II